MSVTGKKHIFSYVEKKAFRDILKHYSRIVESKDTDGATLRAKNDAWDRITREFNASPHSSIEVLMSYYIENARKYVGKLKKQVNNIEFFMKSHWRVALQVTNKQLRRLWMNLKQRQKEAIAKKRQQRIRMAAEEGSTTSDAIIDPLATSIMLSADEDIYSDTLPELSSIPENMESYSNADSQIPSTSETFSIPPTPILSPSPPPVIIQPPPNPLPRPFSVQMQRHKTTILDNEYRERQRRADQLHELELQMMRERLKEAQAKVREAEAKAREAEARATEAEAKADMAEMVLAQKRAGLTGEF